MSSLRSSRRSLLMPFATRANPRLSLLAQVTPSSPLVYQAVPLVVAHVLHQRRERACVVETVREHEQVGARERRGGGEDAPQVRRVPARKGQSLGVACVTLLG